MSRVTRRVTEEIFGGLNENALSAIEAFGAKLNDVVEAKALAYGTSDIVG